MLLFKFSDVRTISQAVKAFNRIEDSGADRDRLRQPNPSSQRRFGRRFGRPQKVEVAFKELIKEGKVQIVRRRGLPPLIKMLKPAPEVMAQV